jgi:hypothetical protein
VFVPWVGCQYLLVSLVFTSVLAERVGFEPTRYRFNRQRLSSRTTTSPAFAHALCARNDAGPPLERRRSGACRHRRGGSSSRGRQIQPSAPYDRLAFALWAERYRAVTCRRISRHRAHDLRQMCLNPRVYLNRAARQQRPDEIAACTEHEQHWRLAITTDASAHLIPAAQRAHVGYTTVVAST